MANVRVKVSQPDGEITVTSSAPGEDVSNTYRVSDGHVTVKDTDVARFLAAVGGSKVAADSGGSGGSTAK